MATGISPALDWEALRRRRVLFFTGIMFVLVLKMSELAVSGKESVISRKLTVKAAITMATGYGLLAAMMIMTLGQSILHAFSEDLGTLVLASGLLIYIALFQLFDAIQIVAAGILRGMQQFVSPLLVILLIYWLLVVPSSYFAVEHSGWGGLAGIDSLWLLLSGGIALAAVTLCSITFWQLCRLDKPGGAV